MDFSLTPEQEALQAEARAFADEICAPGAAARDRDAEYPVDQVRAAAQKGYLGLLVPQEFGGNGAGNLAQCIALEEIARADSSTHVTISVHNSLVTSPVNSYGSEDLKARYLPRLASGELVGAYALTEPHCGSDAAALTTTAVRDGDAFVINGTKMWITTGIAADVMIVFARTDPDAHKTKGISCFLVECASEGFTTGKKENKLGLRGSETVQVFLEDVRVPAGNLLGEPDVGFKYAMQVLNGGRIGIATQSVGIAQAALDACLAFLVERRRNGGTVRTTQDEDFRVSEMATRIEAARLLTWRAAALRDSGDEHIREASMAKLFASEMCNIVCHEAVAMLGPTGWRGSNPAERFFRDARVTELYEGTTEIQKLVISRQLGARVK